MEFTFQSVQPFFIFLLLPCSWFLLRTLTRLRKRCLYPPGPKGKPFVGHLFMLHTLNHQKLAELGNEYGGLVHLQIGKTHMISVTTPEMARQVLQVNDSIYSNRPGNLNIRYLSYNQADIAFAHYGPFWRQMRKLCVTKVFSRKRVESWASVREEIAVMIRFISEKSKTRSIINVGELALSLTRNITYQSAFRSGSHEGQDQLVQILQEYSQLFGAFNIADFFPFLSWADPQGFNKRCVNARNLLGEFIDKIIDDHIQKKRERNINLVVDDGNIDNDTDTDMVDELLAFYEESEDQGQGGVDAKKSITFTRDNIKGIIMDVMLGGTETIASTIEWVMTELLKSPEYLKRAQQEFDEVVGLDRKVEETDINKLTFMKCVVKETLRLHPPIPLLLHETAQYSEINGYAIPERSRIMVNVWAIGRDDTAWTDPNKFDPTRFENENTHDFSGNNFEFIPFGSGRRSCPGMKFAMYSLELAVAHLVHCFSWELPNGMKPSDINMADVFGLTVPKAIQLMVIPTPRLHCSFD